MFQNFGKTRKRCNFVDHTMHSTWMADSVQWLSQSNYNICITLGIGTANDRLMFFFICPDHLLKFSNGYVVLIALSEWQDLNIDMPDKLV